MKWDCDSRRERREAKAIAKLNDCQKWHRWFAWYPVKIGHRDCRWLEFVNRKFTFHKGYMSNDYWTVQYWSIST